MSLLFIDGVDHLSNDSSEILRKWSAVFYTNINTSFKRTGNGSLAIESFYNDRFCRKQFGSNYTTMVVGCAVNQPLNTAGSDNHIINFYDGSTPQIGVRVNNNKTISVYRGNTLLGSSEAIFQPDVWDYYEAKAVFSNTVGSVEIHRNEVEILSLTGIDTCNTANEYANGFGFNPFTGSSTSRWSFFDDIYCDDSDFLGDIKVETLYPSGAGNSTTWDPSAGSNYQCVDEAASNNNTDYISTSTPGEIDTFVYGNLSSLDGTIFGVQVNIMARMDDSGTNKIAAVVRPASTDWIGDTKELTQLYNDHIQMFTVNPEDDAAWEIADVNGCEFGVKLVE